MQTRAVNTTMIPSALCRDVFTCGTVLPGVNGLWETSGILSCSSSTFARLLLRLPCRSPSSSLHRELPQLVVIRSLEREPDSQLTGPRIVLNSRHLRKIAVANVGANATAAIDAVVVAVE